MPIEVGGGNSLVPVIAARRGIPLVDADAMGRAFPESQMVTFHLEGIPCPVAMADERGNSALMHTIDGVWEERMARALTVEMGVLPPSAIIRYPAPRRSRARSAAR